VDAEAVRNGDAPARNRVSSNTSQIRFAGTEKVDPGLNVFWQITSRVDMDNGNTSGGLGNRDTWIGLGGEGWGSVKFGRYLTPYELAHIVYDASYGTGIADSEAVIGNCGGFNGFLGCFDQRLSNSIQYTSPTWGGFNFAAAYVPDEVRAKDAAGNDTNAKVWSIAGHYGNGPVDVNAAYEVHYDGGLSVGPTSGVKDTGLKIAGKYTFGNTSVAGVVERLEYEPTTSSKIKLNTYMLNLIHTIGVWDLGAQWAHASNVTGTGCAGGTRPASTSYLGGIPNCAIGSSGTNQISLFGRYHLSKRTELYALYTRLNNDQNAAYDFTVNPSGLQTPGKDPSGVALGIIHAF
jgi:predicted porin